MGRTRTFCIHLHSVSIGHAISYLPYEIEFSFLKLLLGKRSLSFSSLVTWVSIVFLSFMFKAKFHSPKKIHKYLKKCSTSLVVREMQIKVTMRYQFPPVRIPLTKEQTTTSVGKIWRSQSSFTLRVGIIKEFHCFRNQCG